MNDMSPEYWHSKTDALAISKNAYDRALASKEPVSWELFHQTGDILFIAERTLTSKAILAFQTARRFAQIITTQQQPRFSHVRLCEAPGLYIEATPVSLLQKHNEPAARIVCPENVDNGQRSDFLVVRQRRLASNIDALVNIRMRCGFHVGRPYRFYPFTQRDDAVLCSELVALIYAEVGLPLALMTPPLPFDLQLVVSNSQEWEDVTQAYLWAEELLQLGLIDSVLRPMEWRRLEGEKAMSKALNKLNEAAVGARNDLRTPPPALGDTTPAHGPQTYVSSLLELVVILEKYFPAYLQIRRFSFSDTPPERLRFDAVEPNELLEALNGVADELTSVVLVALHFVWNSTKAAHKRLIESAAQAERALTDPASPEERATNLRQLSRLIDAANIWEPESDLRPGLELAERALSLIRAMESTDTPLYADPKIVSLFHFLAKCLHGLANLVTSPVYGSALLKLSHDALAGEQAEQSAEAREGRAQLRNSLRGIYTDFRVGLQPVRGD
jgi:hypothetical protein